MNNLYVFDCFGVVVSDVSTLWMNKHFSPEQMNYTKNEIFRKVDCNKLQFADSFEILGKMCGMSAADVIKEWDALLYPQQDVVELIRQLKQSGQKTALLSNASQSYITYIFDKYNLNDIFDKTFISANYGMAKPDREFYEACLGGLAGKFDGIYFTDDNPANLVVPQSMGIKTALFSSLRQLKKDWNLN